MEKLNEPEIAKQIRAEWDTVTSELMSLYNSEPEIAVIKAGSGLAWAFLYVVYRRISSHHNAQLRYETQTKLILERSEQRIARRTRITEHEIIRDTKISTENIDTRTIPRS